MPINTNAKTRIQIRQAIGNMTGAMATGTVNGTGSTSQVIDSNGLTGGDDEYNGSYIAISDAGTADSEYRRITDYTSSSTTLSLQTALSFTPTTSDTYEIWDERMPPERVNSIINDAIEEVSTTYLVPDQDESLFGSDKQRTYTIPSNIKLLKNVKVRNKVTSKLLDAANTNDWTAGTYTTVSKDSKDYRQGGASLNLLNASASIADSTVIAYKNLSSTLDISNMNKIEFWIKSSDALTASSLELELYTTNVSGTKRETLNIPALTANTWTRVVLTLSNPELDTAIGGLQFVSNHASELDSAEIWVNRITALNSDTEEFEDMGKSGWLWRVNREDRTLNFSPEGRAMINDQKIKLVGFDTPTTLTTDSATCEIDATTIEYLSAARLLQAMSGGRLTDVDESRTLANQYRLLAADRMSREPTYYGVETT
jgi:hypothetical protein